MKKIYLSPMREHLAATPSTSLNGISIKTFRDKIKSFRHFRFVTLLFAFMFLANTLMFGQAGFFGTGGGLISYNINSTGQVNSYAALSTGTASLGAVNSFTLLGGIIHTFKGSNGNICSGTLSYIIYKQGSRPASPTFSTISLSFNSNSTFTTTAIPSNVTGSNSGDQRWQNVGQSINVLTTANSAGTWVLEVYWSATGSTASNSQCGTTLFLNNSGNNYTYTFSNAAFSIPTVGTTVAANSITSTTASSGGQTITGTPLTASGVVYSKSTTTTTPTLGTTGVNNDGVTTDGGTSGSNFTSSLTSLTPQTQYYVRAYATNASGTGYASAVSFYTLSSPPTAPAGSFAANNISSSQNNLSWTTATFPGSGANNTGYIIISRTDGTNPTTTGVSNGTAPASLSLASGTSLVTTVTSGSTLAFNNTGLTAGLQYNYMIIPFTWDGTNTATYNYYTASAPTAFASVPAATPTAQPTAINFSSVTATGMTVSWTAASPAPSGYIVLQTSGATPPNTNPVNGTTYIVGNTLGNATVAYVGNSTSAALSSLTDNTQYNFKVYSYNGSNGAIAYLTTSPLAGSQTTSSIGAPTANSATAVGGTSFTANWTAVTGATGYQLDVSTSNTFATFVTGYNNLAVSGGSTVSQSVSGLANGTVYYYRVRSTGSNSTSGNSNTINTTTTSPIVSNAVTGDWSSTGSWVGGIVPTGTQDVEIVNGAVITRSSGITQSGAVVVDAGGSWVITSNITTSGNVTINGSFNIGGSLSGGGTPAVTVSSGSWTYAATGSSLIFSSSSTYNYGNENFWPISNGTRPYNVTVTSGGLQLNSPTTARIIDGTFKISGTTNIFSNSGGYTVNGILEIGSGGLFSNQVITYGSSSTLKFNTGAIFTYSGNGIWVSGGTVGTVGVAHPANVEIASGTMTMPNNAFNCAGNLTIDAGASFTTPSANALTVNGNVSNAGTLILGSSSGGDIKLNGNWSFTAGGTFTPNGRFVYFTGSSQQAITRSAPGTLNFDYVVNSNTSGGIKLATGTNLQINVTGASSAANGLQLLSTGGFDLNNDTLKLQPFASIQVGGTQSITSSTGTGVVVVNGSGGNVNVSTSGTLSFASNVTVILTNGFNFGSSLSTINGILQINGGGFVNTNPPTYASTSTLIYNSGGNYGVSSEWTSNATSGVGVPQNVQIGTTALNGSQINFGSATNYYQCNGNLTVGASSGSSFGLNLSTGSGGDLKIGGNYTLQSNAAVINNGRAVWFVGSGTQIITNTVGGNVNFDILIVNKSSGNLQISSSPSTTVVINTNSGNFLQLINSGQLDLNGQQLQLNNTGGNIYADGSRTIISSVSGGLISINGNKAVANNGGVGTLTIGNNVTLALNGAGFDCGFSFPNRLTFFANGSTLQINSGGFINNNSPIYQTGSTLDYNSGGPYGVSLEWAGYGTTAGYQIPSEVNITNGTTVNMPASNLGLGDSLNIINGTLNLSTTANSDLYIAGNWRRSSSGVFNPSSRNVFFDGPTGDQTITAAGGETFAYLTITKATSGNVILANNITLNNTLTLTKGLITTGTNKVIVPSTVNVSGASSASYVNGLMQRNVATGPTFVNFDIGDATNYTPATLSFGNVTAAGDILASVTTPLSSETHLGTLDLNSSAAVNRYWTLNSLNTLAFNNYNGTFGFVSGDLIGGATNANLKAGIYSSSWAYPSVSGLSGNSVTANSATTLGDVVLAQCSTPTAYSVTGGGTYCSNSSEAIGLSNSQTGVSYQLVLNNTSNVGSPVSGTGSAISFGTSAYTAGSYTVVATRTSTGCTANMTGSVNVSITTAPSISGNPSSITVCSTSATSFSVTASNASGYQWQLSTDNGNTFNNITNAGVYTGTNSSTLNISSAAGLNDAQYKVIVSGNSPCGSTTSTAATLNVTTAPSATINYSGTPYCNNVSGTQSVSQTGTAGGTYSYTVVSGGPTLTLNTSNGDITPSTSNTGVYTVTYTVAASGGCSVYTTTASVTITTGCSYSWTGSASTVWSASGNWSGNIAPGSGANVSISNTANQPVLDGDVTVGNISLASGATLTIGSHAFTINGAATGSGTYTGSSSSDLVLGGTSAQSLAFTNGSSAVHNITLNHSGAATVTINSALDIYGDVVWSNANSTLALADNNITLKSTVSGTASISEVKGSLTGATHVTVERFISTNNNMRAWRLLSVPTTGNETINQAWQEGQTGGTSNNNNPGYGTIITAGNTHSTWAADGFDYQQTDAGIITYNAANNSWNEVPSTVNNGVSSGKIQTTSGYFLYIRGDRTIAPSSVSTGTTFTTLRTTGSLYQGDVATTNIPSGQFALIGNVYPSAIDFTKTTLSGVDNSFYVWDPKLSLGGSLGHYQLFSSTTLTPWAPLYPAGNYNGQPNTRVESGQAFFVHANTNGSFTLHESSKVTGSQLVFRPEAPAGVNGQLTMRLYNNTVLSDVSIAVFNSAYANTLDGSDAIKLSNTGENLGIAREGKILAIEGRQPINTTDTVFLDTWNLKQQSYKFEFEPENLNTSGLTAYLQDSYLGTAAPIDLNSINDIVFTVDANAASSSSTRFRIVFNNSSPVPVVFSNIKAYSQANGVEVEWQVATQTGMSQYVVERSTDGIHFTAVANVKANGSSGNYSWLDASPSSGSNYYRIRGVDQSGSSKYTSVVKVTEASVKPSISVYPNPVSGGHMGLQLVNMPAGKYSVRLFNEAGQEVYRTQLIHAGGSSIQMLNVPAAAGIYKLEMLSRDKNKFVENVILK